MAYLVGSWFHLVSNPTKLTRAITHAISLVSIGEASSRVPLTSWSPLRNHPDIVNKSGQTSSRYTSAFSHTPGCLKFLRNRLIMIDWGVPYTWTPKNSWLLGSNIQCSSGAITEMVFTIQVFVCWKRQMSSRVPSEQLLYQQVTNVCLFESVCISLSLDIYIYICFFIYICTYIM